MACARGSILRKDTVAVETKRRSDIAALLKTVSRQIGINAARADAVGAELTGQSRMSATLCTVCYIDRMLYLRVSPSEPSENVSFFELDTPLMVTTLPVFSAAADSAISTYSGLPAWLTVRCTSWQYAALKVSTVVRANRPVCSADDLTLTSLFPLPFDGSTTAHDALAISYLFKMLYNVP